MLALKAQHKSSRTHHAEGNSMASPTQMVVGKGISNLLTAEDLPKTLKDLFLFDSSPKSLTNSHLWNGKTTYKGIHIPCKTIVEIVCFHIQQELFPYKLI